MDVITPEAIPLRNGFTVLLDPNTLFWVLVEPGDLETGEKRFMELYREQVRKKLERDMRGLRETASVDVLEIHTATGCNMECAYCYMPPERRRSQQVMTKPAMEEIIGNFFRHIEESGVGFKRIIFHGGEPCLAKDDIFDVIDKSYRDKHDVEFAIHTNGTLFGQSDAEFLMKRNVHVSYSLDGITPEVNDLTRLFRDGSSTFAHVRETIRWFRDYDWQGVVVTITRHNVRDLAAILQAFSDWGVSASLFNPVSPLTPQARAMMPPIGVLIEEYRRLIDALIEINSRSERRLVVDNIESIVLSLLTSNFRVMFCHMSPCGAGRLTWAVAADGTVYPDAEFIGIDEFALGNALSDPIDSIVNSPALKPLRTRHVSTIEDCSHCPFREICGANCPAATYRMGGTLRAKAPYCELTQEVIKYLFEKIAGQGIEVVYKLVSSDFERKLRSAQSLLTD